MMIPVPDHEVLLPGVPVSDNDAWKAFPKWRWVYNKAEIATVQDIQCGMMPDEPTSYPVVLKPVTNMYGMGWQAVLLQSKEDYEGNWGHTGIRMPLCTGVHRSVYVLVDAKKGVNSPLASAAATKICA